MSDLDALEQAARAVLRASNSGEELMYANPVEVLRLIAAVREAGALDVERLARALDNLWERRWGPLPMPKGQTTVNLENAEAIAAEYAALSPTEPSDDR